MTSVQRLSYQRRLAGKYKAHTHTTSEVCVCVCVCVYVKSQMLAMHLVLGSWLTSFQEDGLEPPPGLAQPSLDEPFCQLAPGSCFEAMQATCPHPRLALPSSTNHAPHPNPRPLPTFHDLLLCPHPQQRLRKWRQQGLNEKI